MNPDKATDKEKLPWGLKEVAPGSFKVFIYISNFYQTVFYFIFT